MNKLKGLYKFHKSIFLRLFLIFLASTLLMAGLVKVVMTYVIDPRSTAILVRNKNRAEYAKYLIDQIGTPPDFQKAKALAERLDMQIGIEGAGIGFKSVEAVPTVAILEADAHRCIWDKDIKIGRADGRVFTIASRDGIDYLFSFQSDAFGVDSPGLVPVMIMVFLLVLIILYVSVRWMLEPLRWLMEGMQEVKKGNVGARIRTRENDELGDLARSFNEMTTQIADVLSSKERLLLDVSHELRSPITRIKVALELDLERQKPRIKKNILELETMITELLESARMDAPQGVLKESETDVVSLIQSVVSDFSDPKDQQPEVLVKQAPSELLLRMDSARVQIVLKNIVTNAVKYSSHQSKPVEIFVSEPVNKLVFIEISDHGFGIPKEEQASVFEPFYRTDTSRVRETGGYGLGLSLCKKIMRAHDGEIEISKSDELGTTVRLSFKTL